MTTEKTKKAFVNRSFKDAGTNRNFSAGTIVDISEGQFTNYAAAGLVRTPDANEKTGATASS